MTKDRLPLVVLSVAIACCCACQQGVIRIPATYPPPTLTAAPPLPTDTLPPLPQPTAPPVATLSPAPTYMSEWVMYYCGYDRCKDSARYGQVLSETEIEVWESPDPDRGSRLRYVQNRDAAVIIRTRRVHSRAGGLWYQLQDGGWISDLWLTEERCSVYNLPEYSIESCNGTVEATEEPTAGVPKLVATDTIAPAAILIPTLTLIPTSTLAQPAEIATYPPAPTPITLATTAEP